MAVGENDPRHTKFRHHLAACPAWRNRLRRIRNNGDALEFTRALCHRSGNRHPLGTHGQPKRQVLHIAAGENPPVIGQ